MKILLLEDNVTLHESLKAYLEMENFNVSSAFNAEDVYRLTFKNAYELYLFDVNLLGENGFQVLKSLRDAGDQTPTMYITALTDIGSMTHGFEMGADDYIKKPFEPEELVLRIRNRYLKTTYIYYKDIIYDPITKEITKAGKVVGLSSVLLNLFHLFITHKNRIIPIDMLLNKLITPNPNALRVNISKLKNRLGLKIKNIKSVGYMLEEV